MKRRRSLLGSKGPSLPGAAGKPGPGDDAVDGEGEGASGSDGAGPDTGDGSGARSAADYRAAYDNALAPPPADPLDDAPFDGIPVAKPAWMVSNEDFDSMRAPTPPPISRRNDVIASPAASSGWVEEDPAPSGSSASSTEGSGGVDYSRAGMGGPLSPIGADGFGGFDDLEPPPTEEVPTGVYEDVSTPYRAPMNVPEPPPIPGIVDRFTPPPVQRSEIGAHQAANRPSYLADATPAPAQARSGAKPFKSYDDELEERKAAEDDEVAHKGGPPTMLLVGLAGVAAVLVALAGVAWFMQPAPPPPTAVSELPADAGIAGVKVRNNMRAEPGLIGAEGTEAPDGAPTELAGAAAAPAPEVPAPAPVAAPEPAPAPPPAPVEAPKPAPAPKPVTAPKPAPKPVAPAPAPVADKGTLKIRANRRVLVYVNGQAIGYTPQDYKVNPGTYSVSAMVPGQPDTKQTLDTKLDAAGATAPVDFSF